MIIFDTCIRYQVSNLTADKVSILLEKIAKSTINPITSEQLRNMGVHPVITKEGY